VVVTIVIVLCALFLALDGSREVAANQPQLLRLHVLANSNHPADQDLKLKVRDAVLRATYDLFADVKHLEEAKDVLATNWDLIKQTAINTIRSEGFNYDVTLELGVFTFPDRNYGDFFLPQGEYEALRIIIGAGQGDNWWCVLFPPLCFIDIDSDPADDPVIAIAPHLDEGDIEFRSKIWERVRHTKVVKQLEEWWLASLELAHQLTLPLLKSK